MSTETELNLAKSFQVTLGSNGEAIQSFVGPIGVGERWEVKKFSVSCTAGCEFRICRGDVLPINQIDYTRRGSGDTSDTNVPLRQGEYISFHWFNGTVGAIGTVNLEGKLFLPGRRAY